MKTQWYTVSNRYGIAGTSRHKTPEAALRVAYRREGDGWEVRDEDGDRWDWPCIYPDRETKAVITEISER